MLTDADILSTLTELFSEAKRQTIVARLYRIPAIWNALRDAGFLSDLAEKLPPDQWLPGQIIAHAYGKEDLKSLVEDGLIFDGDDLPPENAPAATSLKDVAALSVQLLAVVTDETSAADLNETIEANPEMWTTPLACVWPELMATTWLQESFPQSPTPAHARMIATALLANMDVLAAAQALVGLDGERLAALLPLLKTDGFDQLHAALSQLSLEKLAELDPYAAELDPARSLVAPAVLLAASGDSDGAHEAFRLAWDRSNEISASVTDQLAQIARQTGDPVLEAEARRQSLDSSPSPDRRAALARVLVELGRHEEVQLVISEPVSAAESIAMGEMYREIGHPNISRETLSKAARNVVNGAEIGDEWKSWLKDMLNDLGEITAAIDVQSERCETLGAQPGMMLDLARLHFNAGDYASSAGCAELASALDPGSFDSLELLAESLQKSDQPKRALDCWMRIYQANSDAWAQVSRCALEANEPATALQAASAALERDPDSIEAQVLVGRAHALMGEYEAAKGYLVQTVERSPEQAEAWIALAEAQAACGESAAAGDTLQKAVQSSAGDGRVHMAWARWLRSEGQLTSALEHARIALGLDPQQSEWRIEQAEIMRDLGQIEDALPELREALTAQPGNWRAREALALTYEVKGELSSAAHVLRRIPADISPDSKLIAGRILIRSAADDANDKIQQAIELLVAAHEQGLEDESTWYWLGLAYERAGLTAQAAESYQAFLDAVDGKEHPLKLEAFIGCSRTALGSDQPERAIDVLETGLRENPASHKVLSSLAKTYLATGRNIEAEQAAKQAVELEPTHIGNQHVLRDAFLAQNKLADAAAAQKAIIAAHPDVVESVRVLAEIEYASGQVDEARRQLASAISLGRGSASELLELSHTAHEFGLAKFAKLLLQRASGLEPENKDVLRSLAETSERLSDPDTAQSSWLRYAELCKQESWPLERAAKSLWTLGRRAAAIGLRERAVERSDSAQAHYALAESLRFMNDNERSLEHYQAAAEKADEDPSLLISISDAFYDLGYFERSRELISKANANGVENDEVTLATAKAALERKDFEMALERVDSIQQKSISNPLLHAIRIQVSRSKGQMLDCDKELQALMSLNVENEMECISAVKAALSMNAWSEAVDLIEGYLKVHSLSDQLAELILILSHRIRDLDWLYSIACEAKKHSPANYTERLEKLGMAANEMPAGVAPRTAFLVETWENLQAGETGSEIIGQIGQSPVSVQPLLVEAGVIALLKANRPARALELMDWDPKRGLCRQRCALLIGIAQMMLERFDQALETIARATADPLMGPLALYLQSEAHRKSGRPSEALSKLNAALALWPDEGNWHFSLAQEYLASENYDAALPHLQQAVELEPTSGEYGIALARAYRQVGQKHDALNCFAHALQSAPKSAAIWKEAGEVALTTGDLASAEAWLERACTLAPADAACAILSARTALARGDHKSAVKRGQAAIRMQPENPEVLRGMGEILAADGKLDRAIQMYDMALKIAEDDPETRLARGKLLTKSGRPAEAAAELGSLVQAAPNHDLAWAGLAHAQLEAGNIDQALEASNKALKLSPRNVQHMLLLGKISRLAGHLDRALSVLSEAAQIAPAEAGIARELGKVYEIRREHSEALNSYRRALELDPEDIDSLIEAGLILKTIKFYDQAGELFERAVKLNPVDPQALQQLATIRALQLIHGGSRETEAVPS
ncbi:MAG: tetratricopeptide repeat protein [Anaerolineales bacterium]